MNNKEVQLTEKTEALINAALARLISEGKVAVVTNKDGERVFTLVWEE